ncbi:dihydrolipoamide acetyltransferase family protein [Alteribacillus sp. JSM 102045]|uniref:dihydrolipoamide acetyltransferase family protein n=1 Tax=Alteribacillus sp. JSM 102045 TaxID=1562101 RepID=UPI0035C1FE28
MIKLGKEITLPKMGQTMEEAEIVEWMKKEGEYVSKGEILLEVQTDKAALEIEAEDEGYLQIISREGENIQVGSVFAYLSDSDVEKVESEDQNSESEIENLKQNHTQNLKSDTLPLNNVSERNNGSQSKRIPASPAARKLARKNNIDLQHVKGTGTRERIVLQDIQRILSKQVTSSEFKHEPLPLGALKRPVSQMREIIAKRMTESIQQVPQFQIKKSVDMTSLLNTRKTLSSSFETSIGVKLSVNDFFIQAVALTLKDHPHINASFINSHQGCHIEEYKHVNIGLAVATDKGLLVPVFHEVETMKLVDIAKKRNDLVKKAQQNKLSKHEVEGGTFTISNLASLDVEEFTAIINPPETGILAVGCTNKEVVANNGDTYIAPILRMTATFDHRTIDGVDGAKFMRDLKTRLESGDWKII